MHKWIPTVENDADHEGIGGDVHDDCGGDNRHQNRNDFDKGRGADENSGIEEFSEFPETFEVPENPKAPGGGDPKCDPAFESVSGLSSASEQGSARASKCERERGSAYDLSLVSHDRGDRELGSMRASDDFLKREKHRHSLGVTRTLLKGVCSMMLAIVMIVSSLPMSFAVAIGQTATGEIRELSEVRFILNHMGFEFNGGYFEFAGKYLKDIDVYVRISGAARPIGKRTVNTDELVIIELTQEEVQNFSGELLVGGKAIDLKIGDYPNLQSADRASVIINNTPLDKIVFTGSNLNKITGDIKAIYGAGANLSGQLTGGSSVTNDEGTTITLTNPLPPGRKGYQDIYIRRETAATTALPKIRVEYQYINAFRILEKMDAGNVIMFPNTGSKGDELYLESKNFNAANLYEVYFLKNLNGSDRPNSVNKGKVISLGIDVDGPLPSGGKDVLTVKVPDHPEFDPGTYYVLLTKIQNGQIIAEVPVKTGDNPADPDDTFAVIQAGFGPKIVAIHPPKGPDTGSNVEIKARNMITLNIPDLEGATNSVHTVTSADLADHLSISYQNTANPLRYKGKAVNVTRDIKITVGKRAKFLIGNIIQGVLDQFIIKTEQVSDAEAMPKRDVIVEIETVIVEKTAPFKKYIFRQQVIVKQGYEYIPSSYMPFVDGVTPNQIQMSNVTLSGDNYYKTDKKILISLKGEKFFVYRYYDAAGNPIAVKPSVLVKQDSGNTFMEQYQIAFLPNATTNQIMYSEGNDTAAKHPLMVQGPSGPVPATLNITVLDAEGRVVDGTEGNQLGTNLMIELPEGLLIKNLGTMHIQVANPLRGKQNEFGSSAIFTEMIEFKTANDTPIIEKVEPNVVTVDGGDDILLTGSNIAPDAKLYIDANEIKNVQREIDPTGNKVLLKFKSPKNRETITQLLVQNPGGGMAVSDFTFIKSFDKDPVIDAFAPPSGTYGTLVVVHGDNYLRPDPTAVKQDGVDAYRLIGTRVQLDGRDVDVFHKKSGNIVFKPYVVPNAEALIKVDSGLSVFSKLASNSTVKYHDGVFERVALLGNDANGNPMIIAGDAEYSIVFDKANSTSHIKKFKAFTKDGKNAGEAKIKFEEDTDPKKGTTTIEILGSTEVSPIRFVAHQDNHVLRIGTNKDGTETVFLANYAESVTFRDRMSTPDSEPTQRYTLSYNFDGDAILTNGRDRTYRLRVTGGSVKTVQGVSPSGSVVTIRATAEGLTVDGAAVGMITPYADTDGIITGHLSKVLSRTQILFEVPVLPSGRGYKDLTVINPDTKRASKVGEEGFFYIPQASSKPVISTVAPKKGSVDGGYYVTIFGSDFSDDARVFVDGIEVPKKDTYVALNGRSIVIRMVRTKKDLSGDYGVDHLTVPIVVLNPDGGTAGKRDAFTYIIPKSSPVIAKIIPNKGSSNGGEIVEISGYEFRFYEPYTNFVGDPGYQDGDKHEDIFPNAAWDDLFDPTVQKRLEKLVILSDFRESDRKKDIFSDSDWELILSVTDMQLVLDLKALQAAGSTQTPEFSSKLEQLYEMLRSKSPIIPRRVYNNHFYRYTYESNILPKVYFGENEARIVEFTKGFIKVLTPSHAKGDVEVYVINNDSGVSNKVQYRYESTKPVIDRLIPSFGKRGGSEPKEIFGKKFFPAKPVFGFVTDDGSREKLESLERVSDLGAIVRFGNIDNTEIPRIEENSGLINNQRTTVELEGGLTLQYFGDLEKIKLTINERNTVFSREFRYVDTEIPSEDKAIFLPVGMLRDKDEQYYVPTGLMSVTEFTSEPKRYKQPYEYIKVYIRDRRVMVERGYAPKVIYDGENHVTVYTPSYHSIGKVDMTFFNPDGGVITKPFEYTNPASTPKILKIEPQTLSHDSKKWMVESSVLGGIDIEVIGLDFRPGISVQIGDKKAVVKELTQKSVGGKLYDVAVVTVPKGADDEIGREYPVIVQNEDHGLATSNHLKDLIGPNSGAETLPFYFIYRKPLSFPSISSITPKYTSVAGGNTMVVTGKDFRTGAYIIIGTRAGIPIYSGIISELGTKITFRTPENMTLGQKDLQVLNTDYGTALQKDAVHVVSAPTLTGEILGEDGKQITRIHVTGGQKILIKGSGFAAGATVYFGGEWVLAAQNEENKPGADEGLYRDDRLYTVKNGAKSTAVEFVDEHTLRVTTPAVKKEGEISVVVLNKDGGITDDSAKLSYRVPIPSDPVGLKATIVDNRYIKLYDYVSPEAKYFEIYAYIGSKTASQLINNRYRDFAYLGVTDVEPYKIIDLPGWEKMKSVDRIGFVVKGVNKFGQSGYSNIAWIDYRDLKDVKELGPEDFDGDIGVPDGKDFKLRKKKGMIELIFGKNLSKPSQEIDLSHRTTADEKLRTVLIPEEIVRTPSYFGIDFGDSKLRFSPTILSTGEFKELDLFYRTYGKILEEKGVRAPTPQLRGRRVIGLVSRLRFEVSADGENDAEATSRAIPKLAGKLRYSVKVPSYVAKPATVELYRYDEAAGIYKKVDAIFDEKTNSLTVENTDGGYFVLMQPIR